MSSIGKIRKNAAKYEDKMLTAELENIYGRMNPQQISKTIQTALDKQKADLTNMFNAEYKKLEDEYNKLLEHNSLFIINTISVELIYELANQLGYWDMREDTEEERFIKESAKYRIQEMYTNTIETIEKYSKMRTDNSATKKFNSRKKKIEKEFNIEF